MSIKGMILFFTRHSTSVFKGKTVALKLLKNPDYFVGGKLFLLLIIL